jgi:large subunit ribosomal protein L24
MNKIRKGDQVIISTGKDKGKTGTVTQIIDGKRVLVEGVNLAKKHAKPNPMRGIQGGIISKEMPLDISNVAIYNATTNQADKVGFKQLEDGRKIRVYKSNGESIDV